MPNPNPGNPNPPGGVGSSDKFPQYGLNTNTGKIVQAHDSAQKVKYIDAGYVEWFVSHKAAEDFQKSQSGFGSGNLPSPFHGIDQIGVVLESFYDAITDGKLWRSLGWVVLGAVLLFAGIYLWIRQSDFYKASESAFLGTAAKAAV